VCIGNKELPIDVNVNIDFSETFPEQIDCGEQLIITMAILLPFFIVLALLICWIIRPYPHQASSIIEFLYRQQTDFQISEGIKLSNSTIIKYSFRF